MIKGVFVDYSMYQFLLTEGICCFLISENKYIACLEMQENSTLVWKEGWVERGSLSFHCDMVSTVWETLAQESYLAEVGYMEMVI